MKQYLHILQTHLRMLKVFSSSMSLLLPDLSPNLRRLKLVVERLSKATALSDSWSFEVEEENWRY